MNTDQRAPAWVKIQRDEFGVPHIRAGDLEGAYWGMGYAHAMDRGRQMALMRLLGQGRVAECLDGSDESVEIDRFFRRMNLAGHTTELLADLPLSWMPTATASMPDSPGGDLGSSVFSGAGRSRGRSKTSCS